MKKANKILSVILALIMVLSIFSITSSAAIYSGTCGTNLTWTYTTTTYTLTISGTGDMANYSYSNRPWESYEDKIKKVVISDGVTSIGAYAFYSFGNVTSITIPDSVTKIGTTSFNACKLLTTVNLPEGITAIPDRAFTNCSGLTSINIPSSVKTIGASAFEGCSGLTSIIIPDGVTSIWEKAFTSCKNIATITIPANVTTISASVFDGCTNLASIKVDSNNTIYSSDEFGVLYNKNKSELIRYPVGNTAVSYKIPESVTVIGAYAFNGCTKLTSVTIPDNVTTISSYAFNGCTGLESVTIPNNVTTIEDYAFYGCSGVQNIVFDGENTGLTTINQYVFSECDCLTSVTIPDAVTKISKGAFANCDKLANVTIPDIITTIETNAFKGTALYNNSANWENDILYIDNYLIVANASVSGDLQLKDSIKLIADEAFNSCTGLTSVTIPGSVAKINNKTFYGCSGLTSATILEGVKTIGPEAFAYCVKLANITIPVSVKTVEAGAFNGCTSLTEIYYSGEYTDWTSITIKENNDPFVNAKPFEEQGGEEVTPGNPSGGVTPETPGKNMEWEYDEETATLTISGTGTMGNYNINDRPWEEYEREIKTVVIEDGITTVGRNAFRELYNLESIIIPDSVTSIGSYAFEMCNSLTNITLSDNITAIGMHAFYHCIGLTSVVIGDGVASIELDAFAECRNLESVVIGDGVNIINSSAFQNCPNLKNITFGKNVRTIGMSAFSGCSSLESVAIPDSVTKMDDWAFRDCTSLTSVKLGNGLTSTGEDAFQDCTNLVSVTFGNNITIIDDYSFYGCTKLESIVIPSGVTEISNGAFNGCTSLSSVTLNEGITRIGTSAFAECDSLTSIKIPDTVTTVDSYAFAECDSLTSISIGKNVTTIGNSIAYGCKNLTTITVNADNPNYSVDEYGVMFNKDKTILIQYPCGSALTEYTIPDGVKTIQINAFRKCTNLQSVTIPLSVTTIGNCAFDESNTLKNIIYKGTKEDWSTRITYDEDKNVKLKYSSITFEPTDLENITTICGDNVTWTLNLNTGKLVISGSGDMYDFEYDECPWINYREHIKEVVISEGVTRIGTYSFYYCKNLKTVTIPSTVTSIGSDVFSNCSSLESITVNRNNPAYSSDAYGVLYNKDKTTLIRYPHNNAQTEYSLPDTVETIGYEAFYGCNNLEKIVLNDGVKTISYGAFVGCNKLESLTIPTTVTTIHGYILSRDYATVVYYKGTLAQWKKLLKDNDDSDYSSSLKNRTVYCSDEAYHPSGSCGENVTWEFDTITGTLTISGTGAMDNYLSAEDHHSEVYVIDRPWEMFVYYTKSVVIEDGVTTIGECAFLNSSNLTSIVIGDSVTSINFSAFGYCDNFEKFIVDEDNSHYSNDEYGLLFNKDKTKLIECPIGTKIINYTVPDTVTHIAPSAFDNCGTLVKVVLGKNVVEIGDYAFFDCSLLATLTIPKSLTNINYYAFSGCHTLNKVHYAGTLEDWNKILIEDGNQCLTDAIFNFDYSGVHSASGKCGENLTWEFYSDTGTLVISGTGAMYDYDGGEYAPWNDFYTEIQKVIIEDGVTTIGNCAFNSCSSIKNVKISYTVTSIGEYTFANCDSLTNIVIPYGVKTLGYYAFADCNNLKSVTIPSSISVVSTGAFKDCENLETIVLCEGVTELAAEAFDYCRNIKEIIWPRSLTTIGWWAFYSYSVSIDIYYGGTEEEWEYIKFSGIFISKPFNNATMHYKYPVPVQKFTGIKDDYFYIDDVRQKAYQLVEFDGDFYFINDYNKIAKNKRIYLSERFVNGFTFEDGTPLKVGYYEFDADGKMIIQNGVVGDYFYSNGVRLNAYQLVEYDGDFYFINDSHKVAKNKTLYLSDKFVNGFTYEDGTPLKVGYYTFDENGKMVMLNGPVGDYFYKDNVRLNAYQLVEFEGNYYFINDSHKLAKNKRIYLSQRFVEGTDLKVGYYNFDADGKMIMQ